MLLLLSGEGGDEVFVRGTTVHNLTSILSQEERKINRKIFTRLGVREMAKEEMQKSMCSCGCSCCGMGHGGMWGGKKLYMTIGTLAFVYGFVTWLMMTQNWPAYGGWMFGGALLIIIGWVKKMMWKHMHMNK